MFIANAKPFSNNTENISIKVDDVSFSLPTLSAYLSNLSITEKTPVHREILNLKNSKISLGFIRSIFLWRFHIDSFKIDNLKISLLKDDDGEIHFFNKSIPEEEIQNLFGKEKDEFNDKKEENGGLPEIYIPSIIIENINILFSEHDSRKKLWSIDNIFFEMQNFLFPPEKNKKIWKLNLAANFNNNTNSSIYLSIASRAIPKKSFINFNLKMNNIDGYFLDLIANKSDNKNDEEEGDEDTFGSTWFLFSNEFNRIINSFEKRCKEEIERKYVSDFFSDVPISNMIFNFNCKITITNHVFYPGKISLMIKDSKKKFQDLFFDYQITNINEL